MDNAICESCNGIGDNFDKAFDAINNETIFEMLNKGKFEKFVNRIKTTPCNTCNGVGLYAIPLYELLN